MSLDTQADDRHDTLQIGADQLVIYDRENSAAWLQMDLDGVMEAHR